MQWTPGEWLRGVRVGGGDPDGEREGVVVEDEVDAGVAVVAGDDVVGAAVVDVAGLEYVDEGGGGGGEAGGAAGAGGGEGGGGGDLDAR